MSLYSKKSNMLLLCNVIVGEKILLNSFANKKYKASVSVLKCTIFETGLRKSIFLKEIKYIFFWKWISPPCFLAFQSLLLILTYVFTFSKGSDIKLSIANKRRKRRYLTYQDFQITTTLRTA